MSDPSGMLIGITVARGYGATSYIVGHGAQFERVSSRAPDASGQKPLREFPELQAVLPVDIGLEERELLQVKRFGGFSTIERAEQELRRSGVQKVIDAGDTVPCQA